jgi:hypothetical protein
MPVLDGLKARYAGDKKRNGTACGKGAFSTVMSPSDGYEFSERKKSVESKEKCVGRCSCLIYQTLPDESGDYKKELDRQYRSNGVWESR